MFAPNHRWRAQVTPSGRGPRSTATATAPATPAERHRAMTWAQRLKRVFQLDLERCPHCGGPLKLIASIEDPFVMQQILRHLTAQARGPPQADGVSLH